VSATRSTFTAGYDHPHAIRVNHYWPRHDAIRIAGLPTQAERHAEIEKIEPYWREYVQHMAMLIFNIRRWNRLHPEPAEVLRRRHGASS